MSIVFFSGVRQKKYLVMYSSVSIPVLENWNLLVLIWLHFQTSWFCFCSDESIFQAYLNCNIKLKALPFRLCNNSLLAETNTDETNFDETNFDGTKFQETDIVILMKLILMKLILMKLYLLKLILMKILWWKYFDEINFDKISFMKICLIKLILSFWRN